MFKNIYPGWECRLSYLHMFYQDNYKEELAIMVQSGRRAEIEALYVHGFEFLGRYLAKKIVQTHYIQVLTLTFPQTACFFYAEIIFYILEGKKKKEIGDTICMQLFTYMHITKSKFAFLVYSIMPELIGTEDQ